MDVEVFPPFCLPHSTVCIHHFFDGRLYSCQFWKIVPPFLIYCSKDIWMFSCICNRYPSPKMRNIYVLTHNKWTWSINKIQILLVNLWLDDCNLKSSLKSNSWIENSTYQYMIITLMFIVEVQHAISNYDFSTAAKLH